MKRVRLNLRKMVQENNGTESIEWIAITGILMILLFALSITLAQYTPDYAEDISETITYYTGLWGGENARNTGTSVGGSLTSGQESTGDERGFWYHVEGFAYGFFVDGVYETVKGLLVLGKDLVVMTPGTGDLIDLVVPGIQGETREKYAQLIEAIADNPSAAAQAMVQPMIDAWNDEDYGRLIGMGIFEAGALFIPGDEAGKIAWVNRIDRVLPDEVLASISRIEKMAPDELADVARRSEALTPEEMSAIRRRLDEMTPEQRAHYDGLVDDALTPEVIDDVLREKAARQIGADGKFTDPNLELRYQRYIERKTKQGQSPRERADWKVQSDYWTTDSPIARGNRFNDIANDNYEYNEVHLENGKRLDAYDPEAGEIISRKATDFDVIEDRTFETYLDEIANKYPEGIKIRSNKYDNIDGDTLQGNYVLEIPSSNMNSANRQRFESIAKEKGITIRYTDAETGQIILDVAP